MKITVLALLFGCLSIFAQDSEPAIKQAALLEEAQGKFKYDQLASFQLVEKALEAVRADLQKVKRASITDPGQLNAEYEALQKSLAPIREFVDQVPKQAQGIPETMRVAMKGMVHAFGADVENSFLNAKLAHLRYFAPGFCAAVKSCEAEGTPRAVPKGPHQK